MPSTKKIRCVFPFSYLEFNSHGWVRLCCPAWTKVGPVGNILNTPIEQIWNSRQAQRIRQSIYNGQLKGICNQIYLSYQNLPAKEWQKRNNLPNCLVKEIQNQHIKLTTFPINVELADNGECNLRCKMCISNENFNPVDDKLTDKIFNEALPTLLPHIQTLTLSGNGEVFHRRATRDFLINFNPHKYPNLKFNILSNGLLFTPQMWEKIKHNHFNSISISIDAATENTYKKIRGGHWPTLQKNLELISQLRQEGKFNWFQINFVTMKSNYQDMKKFVQLGKKLKVDLILFSRIFGDTPDSLSENFDFLKDYHTISSLQKTISSPIFKDPIVDIKQLKTYQNFKPKSWHHFNPSLFILSSIFLPFYRLCWKLIPIRYRPVQHLRYISNKLSTFLPTFQ